MANIFNIFSMTRPESGIKCRFFSSNDTLATRPYLKIVDGPHVNDAVTAPGDDDVEPVPVTDVALDGAQQGVVLL